MVVELERIKKTFKGKDIEREVKTARHKLGLGIPRQLEWLEGSNAAAYIHAMKFAQSWARVSQRIIASEILKYFGLDITKQEIVESTHNYMEYTDEKAIIRKGAISAKAGQKCVIPMNMADGVILCVGKGNEEWNQSAPHGAGRLVPRGVAKRSEEEGGLSLAEYQRIMKERGIWTSCVSQDTLDEAPAAYKPMDTIINAIGDTVDILGVLRPIYNFKASE
jgi:tRNA-splicing ligase RtcB